MTIDLMKFCDPEQSRYDLAIPRKRGDFIYAADGKILIRVRADKWAGEFTTDEGGGKFPQCDDILADAKQVKEWHLLPEFGECQECDSTGERSDYCDNCMGSGLCLCHCENEHDCGECGGTGKVEIICTACDVMIGNRTVARWIANKIRLVPGVQWGVATDDPGEEMFFRNEFALGAAMPLDTRK